MNVGELVRAGERQRDDLFVAVSLRLIYVGLFLLPWVRIKVTKGLNISDMVFVVAAVLLIASRRPPKKAPPAPAWYFGAFMMVLAGIVASLHAASKSGSLLVVGNAVFVFFVLQWLLRQQLFTPVRIRIAMGAYAVGASVSALVAILQSQLHILLPSSAVVSSTLGGSSRAIGLANQPNIAGVTFSLGLVFAVGLIVELGARKHWYLGVCIAVLAAGLLLTASVSGMSAAVVGLFIVFITRGFKIQTVISVCTAVAAVYFLIFGVLDKGSKLDPLTRLHVTTTANSGSDTLQIRIDTIKHSWDLIVQSPIIGHGLDPASIANFYYQYTHVFYPAHDFVVLFWFAGGIFFLLGALMMMGSGFNRLLHGRLKHSKQTRDPMRDIVLAGCIAVILYSLQGPELVDRWMWLPFMLALCFRDPAPPPRPAPIDRIGRAAIDEGGVPAPPTPVPSPRQVTGRVGRHAAPELEPIGPPGLAARAAPRVDDRLVGERAHGRVVGPCP